jgi:hypothetical protein
MTGEKPGPTGSGFFVVVSGLGFREIKYLVKNLEDYVENECMLLRARVAGV